MKRRLVKLVVFLLLGAIVNVAVAWGACLYPVRFDSTASFDANVDVQKFANVGWKPSAQDWEWYAFGVKTHQAWGVKSVAYSEWGFPRPVADSSIATSAPIGATLESGWPTFALGGLRVWAPNATRRSVVPVSPIWPGFAINTVFYAVILWMLFAAPFALRRRRRIKRSLCPACAYPVGDSAVCTECGSALSLKGEGSVRVDTT